jgi:5-methyltetrahydropteroyltriglutamate--homocysteine methyltransferase
MRTVCCWNTMMRARDRSAPLAQLPDDRMVVLGLVSTKRPALEDAEILVSRINEAARYVDKDRLALSPQCGFSTSIIGNELTIADQDAKLRLVAETARRVWS